MVISVDIVLSAIVWTSFISERIQSQFVRNNNELGLIQSKYCHFMVTIVGSLS